MKKYLILLILLFYYFSSFSQYFNKTYSSEKNIQAIKIKSDNFGNFIVAGDSRTSLYGYIKPFVYKVNEYGDLIDSTTYFQNMNYDIKIGSINIFDNYYVFTAYIGKKDFSGTGPNNKSLIYIKTNTNLDIIDTISYALLDGSLPLFSRTKMDKDSNMITAGYFDVNTGMRGAFLTKISPNGVLLNEFVIPSDSMEVFTDVLVDSNYYYVFKTNFIRMKLLIFDYSFNIIDTNDVNNVWVWSEESSYGLLVEGNYYAACNRRHTSDSYSYLVKSSLQGNLIDSLKLGVTDSCNSYAYNTPFVKLGDYLYYFDTPLKTCNWPNYFPSKLHITKLDTNLNIIWEKFYRGDEYVMPTNIIETNDGGLLLMSNVDVGSNNPLKFNVNLMKIDTAGNSTWILGNKPKKAAIEIFPNPTSNKLNISLLSANKTILYIQIFDVLGKQIYYEESQSSHITINVNNLAKGLYIINTTDNTGTSFSNKFVKE